jgi:hypothetical protein
VTPMLFKCPHIKGWTIKWAIASDKKWCDTCKTWVHATIDWDGHP